jgi:hypothetical protein
MKAQIEIMGLLVIVIVLITAGLGFLAISSVNTVSDLSEAEQRYLSTFTTVLSEANTCQGETTSLADAAAASLYSRDYECGPYNNASHIMQESVNETILNETLDYQFGNQSYTVVFDAINIDNTITYRSCPPLSESDRRAETQPVYTDYGGMRVTLILCTG